MNRALRVTDLIPGARYATALGRLCVLMPKPTSGPGSDGMSLSFAYVSERDGAVLKDDGFMLHPRNVSACLREPQL